MIRILDLIAFNSHFQVYVSTADIIMHFIVLQIFFGPAVPYIYRIQGPGTWSGARKAIMTVDERLLYPLATRKVNAADGNSLWNLILIALAISAIAWFLGVI